MPDKKEGFFTIVILGQELVYQVKKDSRCKRMILKVTQNGKIMVILPARASVKEAHRFVMQKQDWIKESLSEIQAKLLERKRYYQELLDNGLILYRGQEFRIKQKMVVCLKKTNLLFNGKNFELETKSNLSSEKLLEILPGLFKKIARNELSELTRKLSELSGIQFNRVKIKDTKSRWGSCSTLKNINLSWRLVMAPIGCQSYVILHELAHILEMNHSIKFWEVVSRYLPEYKKYREWFKNNGWKLHSL